MNPKHLLLRTLPLWLCAASPLFSDVTLKYKTSIKFASFLPQQARDQAEKSIQTGGANYSLRMKNGKGLCNMGRWATLADFAKEQITFTDTEQHLFATLRAAEFGNQVVAAMPQMPEEAKKAVAALKIGFESKKTQRVENIQGIPAEERELVLTIEMPNGAGTMKMLMQMWSAKPDSSLTNPAIRELMGYNLWAYSFMNPSSVMQKMSATMPGFGDALKSLTDELSREKAVVLRTRMQMYVPMPPQALQALAAQNPGAPPPDPSAPMFELTQEAIEVSSAPVDAALFEIPADYKSAPAVDLVKGMVQAQAAASEPPAKK